MVEVTKYAGSWENNTGGWLSPDDLLGECDGLCAERLLGPQGSNVIEPYNFGFDIPADAVIDHVYIGFHAVIGRIGGVANSNLILRMDFSGFTDTVAHGVSWPGSCDECTDSEVESSKSFTPADLNDETFTMIVNLFCAPAGVNSNGFVDCVWIRVEYHVPVVAPTVVTHDATNIGATSARLNGQISDDGGEACQYRFRYKKSGGAYSYTTWTGAKTTGQTFYENISGLDKKSLYYFNAQAKNSAGESAWGNELSFTTLATIPVVTTQDATDIGLD